ncbi:hypothetical protein INR49_027701 [Caranx melampygus]|nr:hypothetical protein INR49_027701 [Caranx melampygus]
MGCMDQPRRKNTKDTNTDTSKKSTYKHGGECDEQPTKKKGEMENSLFTRSVSFPLPVYVNVFGFTQPHHPNKRGHLFRAITEG